jgi:hypothetical protein
MQKMEKLAMSGAIAGAATPYLLMYVVMPVLNFLGGIIPAFSLKLANPTIAVNVRESLTGIQAGLAGYVLDMFKVTIPASMITSVLMSAAGGAILFVAGGYAAEALGFLKGNAVQKTRATIFFGSLFAAVILGAIALPPDLGISFVNVLIAFAINAAILAYVFGAIDSKAKIGLVPY